MENGTPSDKSKLWQARATLGIKRSSLRKREQSAEEMRTQVRIWEKTVKSLEAGEGL